MGLDSTGLDIQHGSIGFSSYWTKGGLVFAKIILADLNIELCLVIWESYVLLVETNLFTKLVMIFRTLRLDNIKVLHFHIKTTLIFIHSYVAKFYARLRLTGSVLRASKFSVYKLIDIVVLWVYYTIPFGFSLFWHFWKSPIQLFKLIYL